MPAPKSPAIWLAVEAAYRAGKPIRAIGREFETNEKTIRERAAKEGWERDAEQASAMDDACRRATVEGAAQRILLSGPAPAPAPGAPVPAPPPQSPRTAGLAREALAGTLQEARQVIGDAVIEARAEVVARANMATLDEVEELRERFRTLNGLLKDLLVLPEDHETEKREKQAKAANLLLTARGDSISGHLGALSKLMLDAQNATRKALGIDDKVKVDVTGAGAGSGGGGGGAVDADLLPRLMKLPTAELADLWRLGKMIDGNLERPPIPVPPGELGDDATYFDQPL